MEREKILGLLHLDFAKKMDKTLVKIFFSLDVGLFVLVIASGLLCGSIDFWSENWLVILLFSFFSLLIVLCIRFVRNPVYYQIIYPFVICVVCFVKLFWGYHVLSVYELAAEGIPLFSWVHLSLLVMAFVAILYFNLAFWKTYRMMTHHSYKEALNSIKRKEKKKKISIQDRNLLVLVGGLTVLALIQGLSNNVEKGYGICFWGLGCAFLAISLGAFPKVLVALRYKAARWFEE